MKKYVVFYTFIHKDYLICLRLKKKFLGKE